MDCGIWRLQVQQTVAQASLVGSKGASGVSCIPPLLTICFSLEYKSICEYSDESVPAFYCFDPRCQDIYGTSLSIYPQL